MLLTTALLAAGVAGQILGKKPVFLYPADGSKYVYNKLDTVVVTYAAQDETAELYTFCDPGRETMIDHQTVPGFSASVPVLLNFTSEMPCWFDLRTGPNGIDGKNSVWFNVLSEERSTGPQTLGVDSNTPRSPTPPTLSTPSSRTTTRRNSRRAATTDNSSSSIAPTSTPTPDSNEIPTPAPEGGETAGGGMSYWVATGIGLGTGIGLAVLIGLGFMCWCRRIDRQHEKSKEALERFLEARRAEDFHRRHPWSRSEDSEQGGSPSASCPPGGQGAGRA
ncbi:hypothetical protein C8A01DRAFT_40072 [Parachaetomium inaequale]|uniref:Uncharacterized protein n=1 Tax=Parachaetomium inaequale TaxID=2588326 RepID=A0AAN6P9V5_9PEZI|nr:hypothetical protein C8A01DRAFT_40072 [Parachaetomium inaequale]